MSADDLLTISYLRKRAIGTTLFKLTSLKRAVHRLGFVQADPIRSPCSALDLILRHRVKDYVAGDLERRYASLHLEEDFLYAYGFMPRSLWEVIHPRATRELSDVEQKILRFIQPGQPIHPNDLVAVFGRDRTLNALGLLFQNDDKAAPCFAF